MIGWLALPFRSRLAQEWLVIQTISIITTAGLYIQFRSIWGVTPAIHWVIGAFITLIYPLAILRSNLRHHRPSEEDKRYPSLGWGIWISCLRGLLLSFLGGFIVAGTPSGWLIWLPPGLIFMVIFLDFLERWIDRTVAKPSILGNRIYIHMGGLALLAGSIVAVRFAEIPIWFSLTGILRYACLIIQWLKKNSKWDCEKPNPGLIRQVQETVLLGWIGFALMPNFSPPATGVIGLILLLPYLLGTFSDFRSSLGKNELPFLPKPPHWFTAWFPLLPRLGLVISMAVIYFLGLLKGMDAGWLILAGSIPLWALMGIAGRFTGALTTILMGISVSSSGSWLNMTALICGGLIMILGTGLYSLWKPEYYILGIKTTPG